MDVIQEQVDAYNARDLERFISAYAPEVVIEDGENHVMGQGHAKLRENYGTLFQSSPELHGRIISRIQVGKYTIDEEEVTGISGSSIPVHAVAIYRVEADKIVHVRMLR
jgi:hypothetical protein